MVVEESLSCSGAVTDTRSFRGIDDVSWDRAATNCEAETDTEGVMLMAELPSLSLSSAGVEHQ